MNVLGYKRRIKKLFDDLIGPTGSIGRELYVHYGTGSDSASSGTSPEKPLATIDYAIARTRASKGDVIYVMPGHAETVTVAITLDVIGITIKGMGRGTSRPQISCATASIDEMTVTAANCTIENLLFNESTNATQRTSFINVAAANCLIKDCHFDCGQYDLEQITVPTAGDDLTLLNCTFRVTADGPDAAVELEGTSDNLLVVGCDFDGGAAANAWDAAAINSTTVVKAVTIAECNFRWVKTAQEYVTLDAAAEPTDIHDCTFWDGAALASQLNGPRTFHVYSLSGNDAAGCGQSIHQPLASIEYAVGLCSPGVGDEIIVYAGHVETVATGGALDLDVAGIKIRGLGWGDARPRVQLTASASTVELNADDMWIENIIFEGTYAGGVVVGLDVKTSCDDLTFKDCVFRGTSSNKELLVGVTIEATNDRITFDGCFFYEFAGGASSAIVCEGAYTNLRIVNTDFVGTWSAGAIDCETTAVTTQALFMRDVTIVSHGAADGLCILSTDTSVNQFLRVSTFAREGNQLPLAANDDGGTTALECYGTDAYGTHGIVWPATATTWS